MEGLGLKGLGLGGVLDREPESGGSESRNSKPAGPWAEGLGTGRTWTNGTDVEGV